VNAKPHGSFINVEEKTVVEKFAGAAIYWENSNHTTLLEKYQKLLQTFLEILISADENAVGIRIEQANVAFQTFQLIFQFSFPQHFWDRVDQKWHSLVLFLHQVPIMLKTFQQFVLLFLANELNVFVLIAFNFFLTSFRLDFQPSQLFFDVQ
jgi:hypothetical protein